MHLSCSIILGILSISEWIPKVITVGLESNFYNKMSCEAIIKKRKSWNVVDQKN